MNRRSLALTGLIILVIANTGSAVASHQTDGDEEALMTCQQQVDQARDLIGNRTCTDRTMELQCPDNPSFTHQAGNGCMIEQLQRVGWQEVSERSEDIDSQKVTVDVNVTDEQGNPVDTTVLLHDRGGTPDDRRNATGDDGAVRFVEGVGPPPCNTQTVELPEYGLQERLGCNNGGVHERVTFTVDDTSQDESEVDLGAQEILVEVTVEDEQGNPVDTTVLLHDRGGTPDDRRDETGKDGVVRFIEGVGPPPCNIQFIDLPRYDIREQLGCNNGGARERVTLTVGDEITTQPPVEDASDEELEDRVKRLENQVRSLQEQVRALVELMEEHHGEGNRSQRPRPRPPVPPGPPDDGDNETPQEPPEDDENRTPPGPPEDETNQTPEEPPGEGGNGSQPDAPVQGPPEDETNQTPEEPGAGNGTNPGLLGRLAGLLG